ncbi:MAG: DNA polymerase III subunit delta [Verrucomicrobiota bacterium]
MERSHYLIAGSDEFVAKARAAALVEKMTPEDPLNLETVNGYVSSVDEAVRQLDSALEALQTLPFFGGHKVVYLKDANFLGDTPMGRSEQVQNILEKLANFLGKVSAESVQFIMSAEAVDKRRSFIKNFTRFGKMEFFDKADISRERDLSAWIDEVDERVKAAGLKPGARVIERLVELAGNDSRALQEEIEKLCLYAHPHGEIDEAAVRAVGSGNREMVVWDLCDAITLGHSAEAVRLLRRLLAQGETEVGILIILGGHIRLAALGRHLEETDRLRLKIKGSYVTTELSDDADELLPRNKKGEKPNLFRLSKVVQQTGKRNAAHWFRAIEILHQAHNQIFLSGADRTRILETTILELCVA